MRMLNEWAMHSTDQVGFEILTLSLLGLLVQEGVTIKFSQDAPEVAIVLGV